MVCSGAGNKLNVLNLFKKYDCDGAGIGSLFHYNYLKKVETKFMSYDSDDLRISPNF